MQHRAPAPAEAGLDKNQSLAHWAPGGQAFPSSSCTSAQFDALEGTLRRARTARTAVAHGAGWRRRSLRRGRLSVGRRGAGQWQLDMPCDGVGSGLAVGYVHYAGVVMLQHLTFSLVRTVCRNILCMIRGKLSQIDNTRPLAVASHVLTTIHACNGYACGSAQCAVLSVHTVPSRRTWISQHFHYFSISPPPLRPDRPPHAAAKHPPDPARTNPFPRGGTRESQSDIAHASDAPLGFESALLSLAFFPFALLTRSRTCGLDLLHQCSLFRPRAPAGVPLGVQS